jgi:chemotaxis signal transduction protein
VSVPWHDASAARAAFRDAVARREGRVALLVLHVGGERFAVPLAAGAEVVRLTADAGDEIVHRGEALALVDGGALFGAPSAAAEPARVAVLLDSSEGAIALAVDAAVPVHDVEVSAVRPVPWPDDGLLLGVLRRDDLVVALVDVDALAAPARRRQPSRSRPYRPPVGT